MQSWYHWQSKLNNKRLDKGSLGTFWSLWSTVSEIALTSGLSFCESSAHMPITAFHHNTLRGQIFNSSINVKSTPRYTDWNWLLLKKTQYKNFSKFFSKIIFSSITCFSILKINLTAAVCEPLDFDISWKLHNSGNEGWGSVPDN